MKTYYGAHDLREWGFDCLTGEACGLGIRLLYDVNDLGRTILSRTMGMEQHQLILNPSWNGGAFNKGSVLLTYDQALTCALFGMLLHDKCIQVMQPYVEFGHLQPQLYGLENKDEVGLFSDTLVGYPVGTTFKTYKLSGMPGTGDRNKHMFTGRIN